MVLVCRLPFASGAVMVFLAVWVVVFFFWAAVFAVSFALICSRIWRTCSTLRLMLLLLYHPIVCDTCLMVLSL